MNDKTKDRGIFFGWWIVLTGGILTFWGQGFGNFGFTALFKPLSAELGFTRAATSVAPSLSQAERGFLSPVIGWVTDKFGARWMVIGGVIIIGLAFILMNFVNSLWAYYLVWGVLLGIGTNMGIGIALDKTITNWFVKKRGRALSTKFIFSAIAAVLMVPFVGWLVSMQGWRTTSLIAGVVMLVIGPPLAWFFIKPQRPEYYGMLPDGATMETTGEVLQTIDRGIKYAAEVQEIEFTLRQALRTPSFWLLLVSNAAISFTPPVLIIHGIPILTDMGIDPVRAAVLMGIMSSAAILGTLFGGLIADRLKTQHQRFLIAGVFLLGVLGFAGFLVNPVLTMIYPLFSILHFIGGFFSPMGSIILARYFGRKAFGSIRGTLTLFMVPVAVVAPIYAGWAYDTWHNYTLVFTISAVLLAVSTVFISLAAPPKPPATVTDIRKIM